MALVVWLTMGLFWEIMVFLKMFLILDDEFVKTPDWKELSTWNKIKSDGPTCFDQLVNSHRIIFMLNTFSITQDKLSLYKLYHSSQYLYRTPHKLCQNCWTFNFKGPLINQFLSSKDNPSLGHGAVVNIWCKNRCQNWLMIVFIGGQAHQNWPIIFTFPY